MPWIAGHVICHHQDNLTVRDPQSLHAPAIISCISSSVVDTDHDWIRIQWGPWIRIRILIRDPETDPGGQK
jgi:hypothetical protein